MPATEQVRRLGDVARSINAGHRGLHGRIDQNALGNMDGRAFQESDVGRDAGGDNQQIAFKLVARGQGDGQRAILAFFDAINAGFRHHMDPLFFNPTLDHATRFRRHHARHHAVAHFNNRQVHAAFDQCFHDDAADKPGTELQHARARLGAGSNGTGIFQRPAGLRLGQVDPGNRRTYRV